MDKENVSFFFGAGTEGKDNFDLPSGYEFMRKTLFHTDYLDSVCKALSKFWKNKSFFHIKDKYYSYSQYKEQPHRAMAQNLIFNKALFDENFKTNYQNEISYYLTDQQLKELGLNKIKSEGSNEIIREWNKCFKKIFTDEIKNYSELTEDFFKQLFECNDDKIDFNGGICTAGVLEKNFHTIINPTKYGVGRFSKVLNYYWNCFFVIVTKIILLYPEEFKKILNNIPTSSDNVTSSFFLDILNNLYEVIYMIYNVDYSNCNPESYYNIIKACNEISVDYIITTNYSDLCKVCGCKKNIHLNGELKYFEFPENMEILDYSEAKDKLNNNSLFFPFIFGQSTLKPIVHHTQVKEFNEFKTALDKTNILIILGYGINEDDNHINAYLHNYVRNGGKLIYVTDEENDKAHKKLWVEESEITKCLVNYKNGNQKVFDKILKSIRKVAKTL